MSDDTNTTTIVVDCEIFFMECLIDAGVEEEGSLDAIVKVTIGEQDKFTDVLAKASRDYLDTIGEYGTAEAECSGGESRISRMFLYARPRTTFEEVTHPGSPASLVQLLIN